MEKKNKNLCDYAASSSSSDSEANEVEKPNSAKRKLSNRSSDDSTDLRDELLDSAIVVEVEQKLKSKTGDEVKIEIRKDRKKLNRSRSRSGSRERSHRHHSKHSRRRDEHSWRERRNDREDDRYRRDSRRCYEDGGRGDYSRKYDNGRRFRDARDNGQSSRQPKISAKQREQMEKRKLLWGNKEKKVADHWEVMLASCTDEKQAAKLKKLIGLKNSDGDDQQPSTSSILSEHVPSTDEVEKTRQKQEQLFRTLDYQYEIARASTHTHRGMGLGFTSKMTEFMNQVKTAQQQHQPPKPFGPDHHHRQV